jgi:flagellar protein FliT
MAPDSASKTVQAEEAGPPTEIRCPGRNSQRSGRSFREQDSRRRLTMRLMPAQIEIYEEMSALSRRMVEAARASDWDNLIELEKSVSSLRKTLMAEDDPNANLTPEESLRKAAIIQRILDDDAEIRRHTEPWMEQLRAYLTSGSRKKQVARVYGSP